MMRKLCGIRVTTVVGVLSIGLVMGLGTSEPARASVSPPGETNASSSTYTYANCRVGVASWPDDNQQFDIVDSLNAGWYLDFAVRWTPTGPADAEFVEMIRVKQDRGGSMVCGPEYGYTTYPELSDASLGLSLANNPGMLWIIGNEIDRVGQDGVCPQQYAQAYHDAYYFIKSRDATAQIATAGLVEFTPMRAQYLDIVWDSYVARYGEPMPVDAWTMHLYILSESNDGDAYFALGTDPALAIPYNCNCSDPDTYCHAEHDDLNLVIDQVRRMRNWMKAHGQQDKPLLVTEYSILKPYNLGGICSATDCYGGPVPGCFCDETQRTFHPGRVAAFQQATFDYMFSATDAQIGMPHDNNRLVQQWLWYRLTADYLEELGHASRLTVAEAGYELTEPGLSWQQYAKSIPPQINLLAIGPAQPVVLLASGAHPATATLRVTAMNNGNTALTQPVAVTFYSDASLTQPIGSTTLSALGGCARRSADLTVQWPNLYPGNYTFWAKLDSGGAVAETSEGDNVATGLVHVGAGYGAFLPAQLTQ